MLIYHLCIFFGEVSVKTFGPFFKSGCFLIVEFLEFCIFQVTVQFRYDFCKYFLPVSAKEIGS